MIIIARSEGLSYEIIHFNCHPSWNLNMSGEVHCPTQILWQFLLLYAHPSIVPILQMSYFHTYIIAVINQIVHPV